MNTPVSSKFNQGAYEIGAQALNFGALISFMGVNAASFVYLWRHNKIKKLGSLGVPLLGFLICVFLWINLSRAALQLGICWMVIGIVYGAYRTRGFRSDLVNFEISPE